MNTTNIFKQFTKNTVGKFTRIKFTKNGTIRKITGIAAIISIMAGTRYSYYDNGTNLHYTRVEKTGIWKKIVGLFFE